VGVAHFAHGFSCADCSFFGCDTPLFTPANADAQNAREIATLAHPNRPTTQPTGSRRSCHTTNVRFFTRRDKQKTAEPLDYFYRPKVAYASQVAIRIQEFHIPHFSVSGFQLLPMARPPLTQRSCCW